MPRESFYKRANDFLENFGYEKPASEYEDYMSKAKTYGVGALIGVALTPLGLISTALLTAPIGIAFSSGVIGAVYYLEARKLKTISKTAKNLNNI